MSSGRQQFNAPKFNGATNGIRNAWNMLVFSHENAERYGEHNINRSMVKYETVGPIKVYVLQNELEVESTGGDIVFPANPVNSRGSIEKLLAQLKVTATWIYMDRDGNEEEKTREVKVDDPRLTVISPRSEKGVMIDNVIVRAGSGVYDPSWWGRAYEGSIRLRYVEILGEVGTSARRADGEIEIVISADE